MRARHAWAAFAPSRAGSITVEFALIFPVLLFIYIGAAIVSDVSITAKKVNALSYMTANIVAQEPAQDQTSSYPIPSDAIAASKLSEIASGAQSIIAPKNISNFGLTISAIDITNSPSGSCCIAKTRWSYTSNGVLRPCAVNLSGTAAQSFSASQIPQSLLQNGSALPHPIYLIVSDVSFGYVPMLGSSIVGRINMVRSNFTRPRQIGQVNVVGLPTGQTETGKVCY